MLNISNQNEQKNVEKSIKFWPIFEVKGGRVMQIIDNKHSKIGSRK